MYLVLQSSENQGKILEGIFTLILFVTYSLPNEKGEENSSPFSRFAMRYRPRQMWGLSDRCLRITAFDKNHEPARLQGTAYSGTNKEAGYESHWIFVARLSFITTVILSFYPSY